MLSYFTVFLACVAVAVSVAGYCLAYTKFATEPDGGEGGPMWDAHATGILLVIAGWLGLGTLAGFFWGLVQGLDWLLVAAL